MSEREKKHNKCRREVDEERKNKKNYSKRFSKKEVNSNTMMFENVNVTNSNARMFIMFYINNTTSFASILISKFLLEFESFLKIKSEASTKAQTEKEKSKKKF